MVVIGSQHNGVNPNKVKILGYAMDFSPLLHDPARNISELLPRQPSVFTWLTRWQLGFMKIIFDLLQCFFIV